MRGSLKPKQIKTLRQNNYEPFGLKHKGYNEITNTNRSEAAEKYKFQEQERNEELGLNWDSFKWRNYDYAIGRFMNIDPLAEKYNYWTPYAFSGNRVIDSRELEGLEPVNVTKNNPHLVIVALGRAGGIRGDKIQNGNTLYKNLPNGYNKGDDGLALLRTTSLKNSSTVITYAGSDSGITASHIASTIAYYRNNNPNGTITLIGHSLGGKDVLDAANIVNKDTTIENKTINLVMTLEAASIDGNGSAYSAKVSSNVSNIINFNSADSSMKGGGGLPTSDSQNVTNITLPVGTNHTNMDNTLTPFIPSILQNMYDGGNPTNYNQDSFKNAKIYNNGDLDPKNAKNGTSSY